MKDCDFNLKYFLFHFTRTISYSKYNVLRIQTPCFVRIFFYRESELMKRGYYGLTQELIYQWLGSWVTPYWWSDAHVNKALASFLAANVVIEVRIYSILSSN